MSPGYGPGSRLIVRTDAGSPPDLVAIVATPEACDQVASSSECDHRAFRWLVQQAASHNVLPLIDETGDRPSITCPRCGRTSFHPEDVATGYCGACHLFNPPHIP